MKDFNLLSGPEARHFSYSLPPWIIGCALTIICLFLSHLCLSQQEEDLNAQLASINESFSHLSNKNSIPESHASAYQSRIEAINQVFHSAAKLNDFALCLTDVQINKSEVHLFGNTKSADELTYLMHQVHQPHFSIARLHVGKMLGLVFELKAELAAVLSMQKKPHVK